MIDLGFYRLASTKTTIIASMHARRIRWGNRTDIMFKMSTRSSNDDSRSYYDGQGDNFRGHDNEGEHDDCRDCTRYHRLR